MRILYASDLHGTVSLYEKLFSLAEHSKARHIILGGDLLPLQGYFFETILEQGFFVNSFLEPALREFLARNPRAMFHFLHGNCDWQSSLILMRTLEQQGLIRLLHGRRHQLEKDYELIGYAHVGPTPFVIKDGERRDCQGDVIELRRSKAFRSLDDKIIPVDFVEHLAKSKSIAEELEDLP